MNNNFHINIDVKTHGRYKTVNEIVLCPLSHSKISRKYATEHYTTQFAICITSISLYIIFVCCFYFFCVKPSHLSFQVVSWRGTHVLWKGKSQGKQKQERVSSGSSGDQLPCFFLLWTTSFGGASILSSCNNSSSLFT